MDGVQNEKEIKRLVEVTKNQEERIAQLEKGLIAITSILKTQAQSIKELNEVANMLSKLI